MINWFKQLFNVFFEERKVWWIKEEKRGFYNDLLSGFLSFLRDGLMYTYLIYKVFEGILTASDFVFYFSIINQFSNWLIGVSESYSQLQKTSLEFCDLREFLDIQDKSNFINGLPALHQAPKIIFDNVFYKYPDSNSYTIKSLNFYINPGEKIAIVGVNGAGKSTLVKLLCGLYTPTKGNIIIEGRNIKDYNITEYYSMLSVVFQDILLMPVSIAKNIALCEEQKIDYKKLNYVLKQAGLFEKVQTLPHKENTLLLKGIQNNAVDLSGGEKQKLALARCLYKNGCIMILDEPTSALDPISEDIIYQKYNSYSKNATSIFISHRLVSTRFCDRILMVDNGEIVEEGTHEQLMKLEGKYAEMYIAQSHYYKEQEEKNFD